MKAKKSELEGLIAEYAETNSEEVKTELDECKMRETIARAKDAFYEAERQTTISYRSFLWLQLRYINKKWWLFQLVLLLAVWALMSSLGEAVYFEKTLGVGAVLFIVLMIPELWKNRTSNSMEIEGASYYSLRQIYSARMVLFGMVDVMLLTLFAVASSVSLKIYAAEFIIQFLLPMSITAGICFSVLCGRRMMGEKTVIFICTLWSAVWLLVILNDNIYGLIAIPVWYALFAAAVIYLCFSICRAIRSGNCYWEVEFDGIEA